MQGSWSRRDLLKYLGAAALGGAAASAPASASHDRDIPPYVTLSYDEELIRQYQPLLVLNGVENRPTGYHAVYVESAESDLDVIVGFNYYLYQAGVDPAGRDSHLGDREPVYIYIDSASGEPIKVQYSAYHWYENTQYYQDLRTDSTGKRAKLQVVPRWHHHVTYDGWQEGETLEVFDLRESFPSWLDNGLEEELHQGAVYNPTEEMQQRDYWWADGAQNWMERSLASVYLVLGVRGASQTDLDGGI